MCPNNGVLNFSGPTFDLFVMDDGTRVDIEASGYEQDCYDGLFGYHPPVSDAKSGFEAVGGCFLQTGDNDPYKTLRFELPPSDFGVGHFGLSNPDHEYVLLFSVVEIDSTPPTAAPAQSPAANAAGWNNSNVTVNWNWTDEPGGSGIDAAHCETGSLSSGEGNPITLTASCSDHVGNTGHASYHVKVDKTPPTVAVTGVTADAVYALGAAPTPACHSTDALSGVATAAVLSIAAPSGGVGQFTATCSGAVDVAGNPQAANVGVSYSVVYGFSGFLAPLPKSHDAKAGSNIPVKFRLTNATGPINAGIAAALAAAGKVQVVLSGPESFRQTAACSWSAADLFFQCNLKTPKNLLTGDNDAYGITAYEDLGNGFVAAPPVGGAVNPQTIYFK